MGTITSGANGRSDVGWVNRSTPTINDDAKFSKIETAGPTNTIKHYTGSLAGSSGFIVEIPGQGVITATDGGTIKCNALNSGSLYEIGVKQVSGSCTVHVVY